MELLDVKPEHYVNFSVLEMDAFHREIMEYRDFYEAEKEKLSEIHKTLERKKQIFCSILEATGRESYKSAAGTFSSYYRESYRMDSKDAFYSWFRENYGQAQLDALSSINYQTLNSFVKGFITEQNDQITNIPGLVQTVDGPVVSLKST